MSQVGTEKQDLEEGKFKPCGKAAGEEVRSDIHLTDTVVVVVFDVVIVFVIVVVVLC